MAKERAIDLQLIKPITPGSSGGKGKITLKNLFKIYFRELNVGFYDPCCDDPATCPPISQDPDNTLECRADGLYAATGGGGGTLTDATNGVSLSGTNVVLGQNIGQVGNPATLLSDREIPLNGNDLVINGDGAIKYSFQPFFFSIGDLPDRNAQFTARAAAFVNLDPNGTALVSVSRGGAVLQMVINGTGLGGHAELHATTLLHIGTLNNSDVNIITNNLERIKILGSNGNVGIKTTNPTAQLHLPAGATGATNAPLKFTSGALMTTPETGAVEYDGTNLYFTPVGTTRRVVPLHTGSTAPAPGRINFTDTGGLLNNNANLLYSSANNSLAVGTATNANALLILGPSTSIKAPLRFDAGVVMTTPVTGSFEYDGTNLFFTRTGTTRESIFTGVSAASAPATSIGGIITNRYGGDTNFLGDPNSWASVVIGGTTFKIPLYT